MLIKPYVHNLLFKSNGESVLDTGPPSRRQVTLSLHNRDKTLEEFRVLWYEEYLLGLREQWKDLHETNFSNRVKVDDVVLVRGPPDRKRPYWHLGRILEVIPGDDGKVRSVKLKRADGHIAHHSLNHLYPMELSLTHDHVAKAPDHSQDQQFSGKPKPVQLSKGQENTILQDGRVKPVMPDNVGQASVSTDIEFGTTEADIHNMQPSSEASVEDCMDQAVLDAGSHLLDDQVIDHFSHSENLDIPGQDLHSENLDIPGQDSNLENSALSENVYPISRRPRRNVAFRGRPLDDQFVYY